MIEEYQPQARTWAALCHLSALSACVGVPFGNLLGPLVVWLIKKNDYPFVDRQGKEALNFQISWMIYGFIAGILVLFIVGIPILLALLLSHLILVIVAAVRASNGVAYRYPLTIRFVQ